MVMLFITMNNTYGEDALTDQKIANNFIEITTVTTIEETEHMLFVVKTTTISLVALNIKVQAVEANVMITKGSTSYKNVKAIVEKDTEYIYNLVSDVEYLPLQMGSGKYTVKLLGSNDGRRYRAISSEDFTVTLEENAVFLSSNQTVNWDDETDVSILARALTKELDTDEEKLEAIHTYIVENVRYDYVKASKLPKGYIPSAVDTLEEGTGICYDFAALLASMMRSLDIPAKLVKGYSSYTPVYHAWNEVLIDDEWWIVDASTDSIFVDYKAAYVLNKPDDAYVSSKVY